MKFSISVTIVLLICFIFISSFVCCDEFLRVLSPSTLSSQFPYNPMDPSIPSQSKGYIYEKPALFGIPSYKQSILGQLIIAPDSDRGCSPFIINANSNTLWYNKLQQGSDSLAQHPLILLLQRGNCTFATKVAHAQMTGSISSVIIYDNLNEYYLPFMKADNVGSYDITVPSMLIRQSDGEKLKAAVESAVIDPDDNLPVMIQLTYTVPRPDNRVEWDFWSLSKDDRTDTFKQTIGTAMLELGNHALLTPRYWAIDGEIAGCTSTYNCATQCTNGGRYCAADPDKQLYSGFEGEDVIAENLKEICLWRALNSTDQQLRMYDFWATFYANCKKPEEWRNNCMESVVNDLKLANGINGETIQTCVKESGGVGKNDTDNILLKNELNTQESRGIVDLLLPVAYVNNVPYRGSIDCPLPIQQAKCGILQQICAGYSLGTQPAACTSPVGCPFGQFPDACGICGVGAANRPCAPQPDIDTNSNTAVIILILVFVLTVGLGVYLYVRRKKEKLRREVGDLLLQYMPLEGSVSNATTTNTINSLPRINNPALEHRLGLDFATKSHTMDIHSSTSPNSFSQPNNKKKVQWTKLDVTTAGEEDEVEMTSQTESPQLELELSPA